MSTASKRKRRTPEQVDQEHIDRLVSRGYLVTKPDAGEEGAAEKEPADLLKEFAGTLKNVTVGMEALAGKLKEPAPEAAPALSADETKALAALLAKIGSK